MGKRSSTTTKGGKYMNPADRARKDARKRELKKNKKQRQLVRETILKQRDAFKLLEELETLDKTLYDPVNRPKLHESVLREKRRKLKNDFERVVRFYTKENAELASEIRKAEAEYERRRVRLEQFFEQVKHAERVQLDEIPLPSELPPGDGADAAAAAAGSAPVGGVSAVASASASASANTVSPQKSILKSRQAGSTYTNAALTEMLRGRKLPGPPPGPPPELPDVTDEELERAEALQRSKKSSTVAATSRRSRFDANSTEKSVVATEPEDADVQQSSTKRLRFVDDADTMPTVIDAPPSDTSVAVAPSDADADGPRRPDGEPIPASAARVPRFAAPPMPFPGALMPPFNRPPPPMPGPGPAFGPSRFNPPRFAMHAGLAPLPPMHAPHMRMPPTTVSYSAPPSIARLPTPTSTSTTQQAQPVSSNVVEAKPKMKDLRTDVVRLLPTNLQVRRDDAARKGGHITMRRTAAETANYLMPNVPPSGSQSSALTAAQPTVTKLASANDSSRRAEVAETKDDAYEKFMREISGLL